jgi:hypothetical protein
MAKAATVKDVLYALEYMGARLCMRPATSAGRPASWVIEPGGIKVPVAVADEAKASAPLVAVGGRDGEAVYAWGRSAA